MGSFFTSISMRASRTTAKNALRSAMKAHGYRTDNKTPEISFTLTPCGGKWCCLTGEQMDFDDFDGFIANFAAQINAPLLMVNCIDSDFIYLTLYRDGETDCACVGEPYDEEMPVPNREFWQDLVNDFDVFTDILAQDRVFAEEALKPLGELMGFDGEMLLPADNLPENSITLGFSRAGKKESPLITAGPTVLGLALRQKNQPYRLDAHSTIAMHNFGGPSKGIEVIIEATFADRNDSPIDIFDVHLRDMLYLMPDSTPQHMQSEFECISREGSCSTWRAAFPDFRIPDGLNLNFKYPSTKKQMDTEFAQSFVFNYRLRIPEHLSGLNIHFIPMESPEGKYTWRLEECWITPQELEIFLKEGPEAFHEYMRKKRMNE